jgi:hypothetical protein
MIAQLSSSERVDEVRGMSASPMLPKMTVVEELRMTPSQRHHSSLERQLIFG